MFGRILFPATSCRSSLDPGERGRVRPDLGIPLAKPPITEIVKLKPPPHTVGSRGREKV